MTVSIDRTGMYEQQVPVIIDVTATDPEHAAQVAVDLLAEAHLPGKIHTTGGMIESWWTVERVAKEADGNDNEHGVIVFEHDLDYLYIVLQRAATGMPGVVPPGQAARHDRLIRYFDRENGRCGSADA